MFSRRIFLQRYPVEKLGFLFLWFLELFEWWTEFFEIYSENKFSWESENEKTLKSSEFRSKIANRCGTKSVSYSFQYP